MSLEKNQGSQTYEYNVPIWKIWRHKRYILSLFAFWGYMNIYALRTNLSVAIVEMTSLKNITLEDGTVQMQKEFDWNTKVQGYVLSSFFYGYSLTQIFGGYLAKRFGGAKVFGLGIGTTGLLTLLSPVVAKTDVYLFIALRAGIGMLEGMTFPVIQEVWSYWAPPQEKNRLLGISLSGNYFGVMISMPVSSFIATSLGWESIFYVFGGICLLWSILWLIFIRDTPAKDSRIDPEELKYIRESISTVKSDTPLDIPWRKIFTSSCLIANMLLHFCEAWGFYTMMTYLPKMMKSLLNFDLNAAGFLSALPYLMFAIFILIGGFTTDFIISKEWISLTKVRKVFIISGFMFQSIFLITAGYWLSKIGTPICLTLAVGFGGAASLATSSNSLDIAPKFASILFALVNTSGAISGIIAPILTGYIVTDETNVFQWRLVFFIAAGVYASGVVISFFFTSAERQPWAEKEDI